MHTIDILLKRRSIRKFKKRQVPWDNIVNMINCALNAPVAGNVFGTKFIVMREPSNIKSVADACYNQAWIGGAPCLIAVVAEAEHQKRFYGTRGEKLYTIQNAAACTMSMIICAESLGLGTCWIGAFDEDKLRGILGLPEHVNVHVILAVGFPDEQPIKPPKPWIKASTYPEKWWASRKLPSYGFYSENVMKMTKKAGDAIKQVADKIVGQAKQKEADKKEAPHHTRTHHEHNHHTPGYPHRTENHEQKADVATHPAHPDMHKTHLHTPPQHMHKTPHSQDDVPHHMSRNAQEESEESKKKDEEEQNPFY